MTISEKKMQIVIDNYFKSECDVNTSIRQAFEKGFRIGVKKIASAQPEIAENLYLCKCYITDKDGLQHEVIHTGDIRRVTGWEI